jgi:hypothetical protein
MLLGLSCIVGGLTLCDGGRVKVSLLSIDILRLDACFGGSDGGEFSADAGGEGYGPDATVDGFGLDPFASCWGAGYMCTGLKADDFEIGGKNSSP